MTIISRLVPSICIILSSISSTAAQIYGDKLQWSQSHKLTIDDFGIKTETLETTTSSAQFYFNYQVNGFDFLTKNFNKKVQNCMIKTASWIDTTTNVSESLRYQQSLFDISEVYARKLRKSSRKNRKRIIYGTQIAEELSFKIMSDLSKRIIDYNRETRFRADMVKQEAWEAKIQNEISELNDFAYDK